MSYDSWKTRSPDDDLEGSEEPSPEQQRADYEDEMQQKEHFMQPARLRLAIRLWHRFADPGIESFDDETHKAEYLDAVDDLSNCLLIRLLISRIFTTHSVRDNP